MGFWSGGNAPTATPQATPGQKFSWAGSAPVASVGSEAPSGAASNVGDLKAQLKAGTISHQDFITQFAKLQNEPITAGFAQKYSPSNIGHAAATSVRELAQGTARTLPELGASAQQAITGKPVTLAPNKAGQFLFGQQPITSIQTQAKSTQTSHPGGFHIKGTPITLTPKETGLAQAIGKTGIDVATVAGGIKGGVSRAGALKGAVADTKAAVKNVAVTNLSDAITKAQATREAAQTANLPKPPPSALDNFEPLKPPTKTPQKTPLPSSPTITKPTPTPVSEPKVTAGQGSVQKTNIPAEAPVAGNKVSGVAKNIEARAIEKKLAPTTGFDELASFNSKTHAEENAKVANLISTNPEKAVSIARGAEPLPNDISGSKLLLGLEEHAHNLPNKDEGAALLRDLGKSSLATAGSEHGSELSMLGRSNPDSAVAKINEILKTRQAAAETRLKQPVTKAVNQTVKEIGRTTVVPTKSDWSAFIESIKC